MSWRDPKANNLQLPGQIMVKTVNKITHGKHEPYRKQFI